MVCYGIFWSGQFREYKKYLLVESGILGLDIGIQLKESGIHSVQSRIQACLGLPYKKRCFLITQQLAPVIVALSGILVVLVSL